MVPKYLFTLLYILTYRFYLMSIDISQHYPHISDFMFLTICYPLLGIVCLTFCISGWSFSGLVLAFSICFCGVAGVNILCNNIFPSCLNTRASWLVYLFQCNALLACVFSFRFAPVAELRFCSFSTQISKHRMIVVSTTIIHRATSCFSRGARMRRMTS